MEHLIQPGVDLTPLPTDQPVAVRASLFGERLHLQGLYEPLPTFGPLVVPVGSCGFAMLFRYGAAVTFNLEEAGQSAFIAEIASRVQGPFDRIETEETTLFISPPEADSVITTNGIGLYDFSIPRLKVVAIVLARSIALARYETAMAGAFDVVEPLALHIEDATGGRRTKELLRHISRVLLTQHQMVGLVGIQDKPELLWDRPELAHLFLRLEAEYELRERNAVLERKLSIVSRTADTTINLLHNRRILRVEWYIVILILIEIVLSSRQIWLH